MDLSEFVAAGWEDHARDAEGVLARLPEGVALVAEPKQLAPLAGLTVHVAGEHLGRWIEGLEILDQLERLPFFDPRSPEGKAVFRSKAVLHRCAGNDAEEVRCLEAARSGGEIPQASDRVRVLATAAAVFLGQKKLKHARRDFEEALALAAYGPTAADPAARALAVTGNNLACELEERATLSADEEALMLRAAFAGRDFWRIAGGWEEEERAEYRLAMSHLKARDPGRAMEHARRCLEIVAGNGSDAGEMFFAREAIARAHLAAGRAMEARRERDAMAALVPEVADDSFRSFCAGELTKLNGVLAP
jgi:hypothetical protein